VTLSHNQSGIVALNPVYFRACFASVSAALLQMVHQTEKEVCKQLGIGLTFWKETISGWGIKPWPQRYCNRLRRCIADVEACRGRVPQDTADSLLEQLR
jgi:hypothetical protein